MIIETMKYLILKDKYKYYIYSVGFSPVLVDFVKNKFPEFQEY